MSTWLVVLLFSVGAVLLFVVGMSLTLIFKGHHIDGEISTNRHMRALGITCAVQDAMHSAGGHTDDCGNACISEAVTGVSGASDVSGAAGAAPGGKNCASCAGR